MGSWECSSIGRGVPPGPVTIQPSINTLYSILNWKFQDLHPIWCMIFIIKCFVFTPMEMSPCQWKAENKEFCLALRVIELEGFFRVSYLLWHEECFCKITPNPHNLWDLSLWVYWVINRDVRWIHWYSPPLVRASMSPLTTAVLLAVPYSSREYLQQAHDKEIWNNSCGSTCTKSVTQGLNFVFSNT